MVDVDGQCCVQRSAYKRPHVIRKPTIVAHVQREILKLDLTDFFNCFVGGFVESKDQTKGLRYDLRFVI